MKEKILTVILNSLLFSLVFIGAFSVASLGLVRKVNSYRDNPNNASFIIEKEEVIITTNVSGRIQKVNFRTGQHVNAGDVIMELADEAYQSRLRALETLAVTNQSANAEATLLRAQANEYQIIATRDGIIKELETSQGSVIPVNSRVVTIQADTGATLTTSMDYNELQRVQRLSKMEVFSDRLEQSFTIVFSGVGQVDQANYDNKYQVYYVFEDPQDGAAFIEGESVVVVSATNEAIKRPADLVADVWNALIIGR